MIPKLKYLFIIILIAVQITCEKDNGDIIPDTYVNFTIRTDDAQFSAISVPGNSVFVDNVSIGTNFLGYNNNGVIIYNNGNNEFYAFDATCPQDVASGTAVELNNPSFATCPVCNSIFLFASSGNPSTGSVAKYPLKNYRTSFIPGSGEIHVYN